MADVILRPIDDSDLDDRAAFDAHISMDRCSAAGAFDNQRSAHGDEPHHVVGQAIGDFYRDRRRDDLTLISFTGQGLKDDDGHLYLAMADTARDNLLFTALPACPGRRCWCSTAVTAGRSRPGGTRRPTPRCTPWNGSTAAAGPC